MLSNFHAHWQLKLLLVADEAAGGKGAVQGGACNKKRRPPPHPCLFSGASLFHLSFVSVSFKSLDLLAVVRCVSWLFVVLTALRVSMDAALIGRQVDREKRDVGGMDGIEGDYVNAAITCSQVLYGLFESIIVFPRCVNRDV